MALPLTHGAAGYAVYELVRPVGPHRVGWAMASVVFANAPDVDFLPGLLIGEPAAFHRGVTHTIGAVVLVSAVAWWAAAWRGLSTRDRGWVSMLVGFAWASHLLVDYLAMDVVAPHGAPFLWPFSDAYYLAPHPLIPEIIVDPAGRGAFLESIVSRRTWAVWLWELWACVGISATAFGFGVVRNAVAWRGRELAE